MPGPLTIQDGELVVKDPTDESVYAFDWDIDHLATGVQIGTCTFTISSIPSGDAVLTKDSETKLTAALATIAVKHTVTLDDRVTQLRLKAGTLGMRYRIDNKVVTNESPAQTKERSFFVLVQDK